MPSLIGSDGVSPTYDPDGLWRFWNIDELWQGPTSPGTGRFVGKLRDYVIDPDTFETWKITALDAITLKPTLQVVTPAKISTSLTNEDILFGVGPGTDAETYRAYLNTSVEPYTLTVEQRCHVYGTMSSYAKIFLGSDTSLASGEVISKVFDASGNFLTDAVGLELAALDNHTNYSVKAVKQCNITKKLVNGERITVVLYADDGQVVSKRQMLIENTDLISDVNSSVKYITDISLKSVWLSPTIADQLEYPLNIPMDAMNLVGVVTYSDGSTLELAVGSGKFEMLGLDGRLSTIVGQPHELVLRYRMADGETSLASTGVNGRYITKPYRIITINPNNSISVKLFGYPVWVNATTGYVMKWFLLNIARNVYFDVTTLVKFSASTGAFNPLQYGYLQRKAVTLNLRDVSSSFIAFNHTQVVDILLNGEPSNDLNDAWLLGTEASDTYPRFGAGVYGKKIGNLVDFSAGFTNKDDWLTAYYWQTRPLVDSTTETAAPTPTHFIVTHGTTVTEWAIDQWNEQLAIAETVAAHTTATIRFIRRTAGGDLQLGYAAAMIKALA